MARASQKKREQAQFEVDWEYFQKGITQDGNKFCASDFYYRTNRMFAERLTEILNSLTWEQRAAVVKYGSDKYASGEDDGHASASEDYNF